jgi:hypothetical protein
MLDHEDGHEKRHVLLNPEWWVGSLDLGLGQGVVVMKRKGRREGVDGLSVWEGSRQPLNPVEQYAF